MSTEVDPILEEFSDAFEDGEVDYGGPYGVGKWPEAVLMDVNTIEGNTYGYRVQCVFNLKGEEGMKYTGRLDLPRTPNVNGDENKRQAANKANEITRNLTATVLHSAGVLPEGKKPKNVDTDEEYERIVSVLRYAVGRNVPIEVRVQRRKNKETGKYEDTDFTTFQGLRPKKA